MKRSFIYLLILLSSLHGIAQINITLDIGAGQSKRNVVYKDLTDSAKDIIKKNELPGQSFGISATLEKKIGKRFWVKTGLGYSKTEFETRKVRFAPWWVSSGYADSTGFQLWFSDKTIVLPAELGYDILNTKKHKISVYTGIDLLYKIQQKQTIFLGPVYEEPSSGGYELATKGVSKNGQEQYNWSAQIPFKLQYLYKIKRFGVGANIQYTYVLGKTNTPATDDGFGYIGIKEQTSGRMSFCNMGLSFMYNIRKYKPIEIKKDEREKRKATASDNIANYKPEHMNIAFDVNFGMSKRHILYKKLADNTQEILKSNERPGFCYSIEAGMEKRIKNRLWLYAGLGYNVKSFKTKAVRFAPWYVTQNTADSTGYFANTVEKTFVLPVYVGYDLLNTAKQRLCIFSGIGVIYKSGQYTDYDFELTYNITPSDPWQKGWSSDGSTTSNYKLSAQIPLKLQYIYKIKRMGLGANFQYAYVSGKTNTPVTNDGYGYIGIKEQTSGRMSCWSLGLSVLYKLK